jgi:tetratricopeptide (TPR) repeat protein
VDLEPERRADILALEARLETEDLFALLGVPPGAEPAAVKAAFYELSRRYHPDRFFGRNLGSFRPRLERIFRRLNEAHATLTEPEKRRAWLVAHPQLARTPTPVRPTPSPEERLEAAWAVLDEGRDAERRARLARHPYLLRTGRMRDALVRGRELLARGEYETAVNELGRAQQLEPGNREVAGLLGEARRRAEQQRAERELARGRQALAQGDAAGALAAFRLAATQAPQNAEAAWQVARLLQEQGGDAREVRTWAQRAVDLAPRNAAYRYLLGVLLLEAGAKKVAKTHFESVLELEPGHPGAREKLKGLRWVF